MCAEGIAVNIIHPKIRKKKIKTTESITHPLNLIQSMRPKMNERKQSVLRLEMGQVIRMMQEQAAEQGQGIEVLGEEHWPPIAWVLIQAEAAGQTKEQLAQQLGVEVENVLELIKGLIQGAESESQAFALWDVGVVALRSTFVTANQVLATTWDQVEAMAIEKLAIAIQNVNPAGADPLKLMQIASTANKAVRRQQGESGQAGRSNTSSVGRMAEESAMELELQSGDLGSLTIRLSPRVRAQMASPHRVIDSVAREVRTPVAKIDLKTTREIIDQADREAGESSLRAKPQEPFETKKEKKAKEDIFRLGEHFGISQNE